MFWSRSMIGTWIWLLCRRDRETRRINVGQTEDFVSIRCANLADIVVGLYGSIEQRGTITFEFAPSTTSLPCSSRRDRLKRKPKVRGGRTLRVSTSSMTTRAAPYGHTLCCIIIGGKCKDTYQCWRRSRQRRRVQSLLRFGPSLSTSKQTRRKRYFSLTWSRGGARFGIGLMCIKEWWKDEESSAV